MLNLLKSMDLFQTSKTMNISQKNKKTGKVEHKQQMGSHCGGLITILCCLVMAFYFISLTMDMYSGANDNFTHSINENLFDSDEN